MQTFIMKVVFPIAWITGFGLGTLLLWVNDLDDKWQFLFAWIAGTGFILWGCAGLKKVQLGYDRLYISNYLRQIEVPLHEIESVTENRWINLHPVTIHFRNPTEFGRKVTFMPTVRIFGWTSHPVVNELEVAAGGNADHAV